MTEVRYLVLVNDVAVFVDYREMIRRKRQRRDLASAGSVARLIDEDTVGRLRSIPIEESFSHYFTPPDFCALQTDNLYFIYYNIFSQTIQPTFCTKFIHFF